MVRWREVPGRTRRGVYRRLAAHDTYDSAGETVEKGGKQGIKEEGQEQSATAADRREETTDLRFHPGGKAARCRAAIRAISACAVAIAYSLAQRTGTRNFFTRRRFCRLNLPTAQVTWPTAARAASGHATVAPPSSVMNSRRFIRSPRRQRRARPAISRFES